MGRTGEVITDDGAKTAIAAALDRIARIQHWDPGTYDKRGYRRGYRALRHLFQVHLKLGEEDTVLACANAVYGWMPRILGGVDWARYDFVRDELAQLANERDRHDCLSWIVDIPEVKKDALFSFVNGSAVGTSKFLHFMNPLCFPIWDSRVARSIGIENDPTIRRAGRYEPYLRWANTALDASPAFSQGYLAFLTECGSHPATDMRKLEFALFTDGERTKKRKTKALFQETRTA